MQNLVDWRQIWIHACRTTVFFQDGIKLDLGQGRKRCFRPERKRVNKCDSLKWEKAEGFSTPVTGSGMEGMPCSADLSVAVRVYSLRQPIDLDTCKYLWTEKRERSCILWWIWEYEEKISLAKLELHKPCQKFPYDVGQWWRSSNWFISMHKSTCT